VEVLRLLFGSIPSLDLAMNYTTAHDVLARTSPIFGRKIYSLVPSNTNDMYEEEQTLARGPRYLVEVPWLLFGSIPVLDLAM
jgi:hypothetical protein